MRRLRRHLYRNTLAMRTLIAALSVAIAAQPVLPALLASVSGPSVPGQRAPRVPSRDLSQPDLLPRLHGQDPSLHPGRDIPRRHGRTARPRGPDTWR